MKTWLLLPLSVLVAIPAQSLLTSPGRAQAARTPHYAAPERGLARLQSEVATVAAENGRLRVALAGLERPAAPPATPAVDEDDIERAVADWLAARAIDDGALTEPASAPPAARVSAAADLSIEQLLEFFDDRASFDEESTLMYEELRKSGRIDEFVAALEARVAAHPDDSALHASLGVAYLQQLFGLGATPEAGRVAMQADKSFDRAIELDPRNLQAHFTKAISLSNWPDFMGRTDDAIRHFEAARVLVEEPGAQGSSAELYLFLGNMYQRVGEGDKAAAAWRTGLRFHPTSAALAEQLALHAPDEATR
jgi:tetratricopeptide (TPR) repeat protein